MSEAAVAPAPAAASSPAPAAAPSSAPAASPAPTSAPAPATAAPQAPQPTRTFGAAAGVESHVDPNDSRFKPGSDDYLQALVQERLQVAEEKAKTAPAEVAPVEAGAEAIVEPVIPGTDPEVAPEVPAPDAEAKPAEEKPVVAEPEFELNPPKALTPEALSKMLTDSPEFGKLLESNPALKGQIYKTAREAAELKPYKELFPDFEAAKEVVKEVREWHDTREVFLGASTKEGTEKALGKMAELCYERDEEGNVLMQNGSPVIGEDFYGFVDNVVLMDLEHDLEDVSKRLTANQYHLNGDYKTQEEIEAAYQEDKHEKRILERKLQRLAGENKPEDTQALPEHLQRKAAEISAREAALREKEHGTKVQTRTQFEKGLQDKARTRGHDEIGKIMASVKKQGAVIAPFLEEIIPNQIATKMWAAISADEGLRGAMQQLQRLPVGEKSEKRRIATIDRAIQTYLPDIAAAVLLQAGVQVAQNSAAKKAAEKAQADATNKTEPRGSVAPAGMAAAGGLTMTSGAAFDHAQAEWQKANPNKPFDKVAKESILPRMLQLMTAR
jgi:hypothetical protein